jgi:hypothetical protein
MNNDFDKFWTAYPRKIAKGDARKAWHQTSSYRPDIDAVVKAVEAQRRSDQWTRDGGMFIPYPATWLRAERWDDVLEVELPKPERKLDRYELANMELAKREAEFRARQALQKAAA